MSSGIDIANEIEKDCAKDEMKLPEGKTCGDCKHLDKCERLFGVNYLNTVCDFYPPRFIETPE